MAHGSRGVAQGSWLRAHGLWTMALGSWLRAHSTCLMAHHGLAHGSSWLIMAHVASWLVAHAREQRGPGPGRSPRLARLSRTMFNPRSTLSRALCHEPSASKFNFSWLMAHDLKTIWATFMAALGILAILMANESHMLRTKSYFTPHAANYIVSCDTCYEINRS